MESDVRILRKAVNYGIINKDDITEKVEMKEKQEILDRHPFPIWQGENNGYWYTRFIDEKGKNRLKKLKRKEDIENFILELYTEKPLTVGDVFKLWIAEKRAYDEISPNSAARYDDEFQRYFSNLKSIPIEDVTETDLGDFALNLVRGKKVTAKAFAGMRTVCYGIFKYARREKLTDIDVNSVFGNLNISRTSYKPSDKAPEDEIFGYEETFLLTEYLKTVNKPVELGILLMFATGIRVGELSAIKWENVKDGCINIRGTETRIPQENGGSVYEVKDTPKTTAGIRQIPIPTKYIWILDRMRVLNPDAEYVFTENQKRIRTFTFRRHLEYACDKVGIPRRSPHKIRKTFASTLLDHNCSEKLVTELMGHTSISVTLRHYARDRKQIEQKRNVLDGIAGL